MLRASRTFLGAEEEEEEAVPPDTDPDAGGGGCGGAELGGATVLEPERMKEK